MDNHRVSMGESQPSELAAMKIAYEQLNVALQENPDSEAAFRLATELAESLREMAEQAALARARAAARMSDAEQLSLSGLAEKLGISKARASQLLRAARENTIS